MRAVQDWIMLALLSLSLFGRSTIASAASLADFTVKDGTGADFSLSRFKDTPAVLIVNVASACGYTDVNYRELQALRNKYDDRLAIVAFPCNQFGRQEPGSWEEISAFVGQQFGVTFPVMGKTDVNGGSAEPLFDWLKTASNDSTDIPWNFSKFLVTCGSGVKRYSHQVNPVDIEGDIVRALAECPRTSAQEL